ncbi:MAG: FHA domain-containing protein [Candidatus Eremiobacteraeota bacterium]|nr:FHA domain-containing protein [Candidatus Eremiobacteraeota bacterium]
MIARKLVATFESGSAASGRAGRRFVVRMSPADASRAERDRAYLERQWTAMLAGLAERSRRPQRSPQVAIEADGAVANGTVVIAVTLLAEPARLALVVRKGVPPGARVRLDRSLTVGRDEGCDVVLVDARVSRRHIEIVTADSIVRFRDLGSSNGTRLNGQKSAAGELDLGDVLALGDSELAVVADDEP